MEFERVRGGLFVVGDGSEWFLVDEEMLMALTEEMNGVLVDPLKTTIVQDYRCHDDVGLEETVLTARNCISAWVPIDADRSKTDSRPLRFIRHLTRYR